MRFEFGTEDDDPDARAAALRHMDAALGRVVEALSDGSRDDAARVERARAEVASLNDAIELEVLRERDGELVILSARLDRRLRPMVRAMVERAPRSHALRFVAHRPPRPFAAAVEGARREHGFDLSNARARAGFARGHLLDLVVYGERFAGRGDERGLAAAEWAAEALLGERAYDDWISEVAAEPLPRGGPLRVLRDDEVATFPLVDLPAALSAAAEGLRAALPELPRWPQGRDGWTLFETEPEPAHDYSAQDDIALASSVLPEMLKCFLEGAPFSSLRFARGGESFAYLKLDWHDVSFEERLARRSALEDALAERLAAGSWGSVVGNGLGLRYTYVDAAIAASADAIASLREVAQRMAAPKRSWIQFFDSDLASEWVGVWPDSPAPPGV